jgi:hypothetical protein
MNMQKYYIIFNVVTKKARTRTIWTSTQHLKPGEILMRVRLSVPEIKLPEQSFTVPESVVLGSVEYSAPEDCNA